VPNIQAALHLVTLSVKDKTTRRPEKFVMSGDKLRENYRENYLTEVGNYWHLRLQMVPSGWGQIFASRHYCNANHRPEPQTSEQPLLAPTQAVDSPSLTLCAGRMRLRLLWRVQRISHWSTARQMCSAMHQLGAPQLRLMHASSQVTRVHVRLLHDPCALCEQHPLS
jgi:hypothetical protein